MQSKIFVGVFLLLISIGKSSQAQLQIDEPWKLKLSYQVAAPMSGIKNYTPGLSANGWSGQLSYQFHSNWQAGLLVGFQDFYEKIPRTVYTSGTQSISAVQSRSIQYIPVMANVHYFTGKEGKLRAFGTAGLGGAFVRNNKFWGEFSENFNQFSFSASAGMGIRIPVGVFKTSYIEAGLQYHLVPYSSPDVDNLNHVQANIGFHFPLR
jgi:hypothetical protein